MLKIGDTVWRVPSTNVDELGRNINKPFKSTVVYIHPKGRYHEVQFDFPGGSFRESYYGTEN